MVLLSDSICVDILVLVVTSLIAIVTYYKWEFAYWKRKNVPFVKPSIPFGTIGNPLKPSLSFGEIVKKHFEESKKKGYKHVGLFTFASPIYVPIDTEYIKAILSKDFPYFTDRGFYSNEKDDPLSSHLVALDGSRWRNMRAKLTPTFTSGKMKMMFPILIGCGKQLSEAMIDVAKTNEAVNIKEVLGNYATDVIGSCAFGLDCNSFKDPDSIFRKHGLRVFVRSKFETMKDFVSFASPSLAKSLGLVVISNEVRSFFLNIIKEAVDHREKNEVIRNDFLKLLMDLKNNADGGLTINELAAQGFLFFVAGFETSSSAMTFCLYELAQNQEIQERVRDEINSVLDQHNGEVDYEALNGMKYMKQVIDETLRKHPPFTIIFRQCAMNYTLPDSSVTIEKGTKVLISAYALHYDPEYFSDPDTFDPERFNAENKKTIKPFTYMPFGEGPRNCIGLRFGLMQVGVGLTYLLQNFRFSLSEKTKLPLKINPNGFTLSVLGDIWLNVERV